MSDRIALAASKRDVIGKKVKRLRNAGQIPGVIYGPDQPPVHVQMSWRDLRLALRDAGGTNLVELDVSGETYTTLIRVVDRHPVTYDVLHIDFYAVNLKQKLISTVPVTIINDVETRLRLSGQVIQEANTLDVESLPTNIPSEIVIDAAVLQEIGDSITIADLSKLEDAEFVDDPDTVVVRTDYLREVTEEAAEEEDGAVEEGAEPEVVARGKQEEASEE